MTPSTTGGSESEAARTAETPTPAEQVSHRSAGGNPAARQTPGGDAAIAEGQRVIRSSELLAGQSKVLILHDDTVYRLLKTKNGKLILQK